MSTHSDSTAICVVFACAVVPAGFHTYEGSDDPWVSDGRPSENVFTGNIVSNTPTGVNHKDGDSNEFIGTTLIYSRVVRNCIFGYFRGEEDNNEVS